MKEALNASLYLNIRGIVSPPNHTIYKKLSIMKYIVAMS